MNTGRLFKSPDFESSIQKFFEFMKIQVICWNRIFMVMVVTLCLIFIGKYALTIKFKSITAFKILIDQRVNFLC